MREVVIIALGGFLIGIYGGRFIGSFSAVIFIVAHKLIF
jgi:hypothetical protein